MGASANLPAPYGTYFDEKKHVESTILHEVAPKKKIHRTVRPPTSVLFASPQLSTPTGPYLTFAITRGFSKLVTEYFFLPVGKFAPFFLLVFFLAGNLGANLPLFKTRANLPLFSFQLPHGT